MRFLLFQSHLWSVADPCPNPLTSATSHLILPLWEGAASLETQAFVSLQKPFSPQTPLFPSHQHLGKEKMQAFPPMPPSLRLLWFPSPRFYTLVSFYLTTPVYLFAWLVGETLKTRTGFPFICCSFSTCPSVKRTKWTLSKLSPVVE